MLAVARGETGHSDYAHPVDARGRARRTARPRSTSSPARSCARPSALGVPVPLSTALYRLVKAQEASWTLRAAAAVAPDARLRRRLRRGRQPLRRAPRDARRTSRSGPTTSSPSTSRRSTRDGLRLTGARRARRAPAGDAPTPAEIPPCEFGIVATKSMYTEAAIAATAHALRRRRRLQRPERGRQRGADRRARRARDPRHDLPGRARRRARRRPDGHRRATPGSARSRTRPATIAEVERLADALHARRHADEGARRRARRAVDEADLQRRDATRSAR